MALATLYQLLMLQKVSCSVTELQIARFAVIQTFHSLQFLFFLANKLTQFFWSNSRSHVKYGSGHHRQYAAEPHSLTHEEAVQEGHPMRKHCHRKTTGLLAILSLVSCCQ